MHRQPGCWLRSSHTLKECVTAHWSSDCAPKMSGAKPDTEAVGMSSAAMYYLFGRGASYESRSVSESERGFYRRENAGMSSESKVRIFAVECLRFPEEGSSTLGKSGPKPRT